MTVFLWRIATEPPHYEADDLSGAGAQATGGRWNRKGRPVIYTSTSIALACLETVVHLATTDLPLNRFLVRISVPQATWDARKTLSVAELPVGWPAIPEGRVSLTIGDAWLAALSEPILLVPSVVVPEEFNALLNPLHPLAAGLRAKKLRAWNYDGRLQMKGVSIRRNQ